MADDEPGREAELIGTRTDDRADRGESFQHGRDLGGGGLRSAAQQRVSYLVGGQIQDQQGDRPGLVGGDESTSVSDPLLAVRVEPT